MDLPKAVMNALYVAGLMALYILILGWFAVPILLLFGYELQWYSEVALTAVLGVLGYLGISRFRKEQVEIKKEEATIKKIEAEIDREINGGKPPEE